VADVAAAGPFNSPLRIAAADAEAKVATGAWERPISIYRADYAVLSVCSQETPGVVWFAPHTAHASVFAPVWTSSAGDVARPYHVDTAQAVDRKSLFWAVSAVSNWAYGSMFSHAIVDICAAQAQWEPRAQQLADTLATAAAASHSELLAEFAEKVHAAWWDLFWSLMGKYNDGYVISRSPEGAVTSTAVGYPSWWLQAVHFETSVPAANSSFANLKHRMADAAKTMADIDARRKHPKTKNMLVV